MRISIIGAGGQLASDLARALSAHELTRLRHQDFDVCDADQVSAMLREAKPEVVINTAAYHRVDDCESEVGRAFEVNSVAPIRLAQVCREMNATLVHISTDYVFGGQEKREPLSEEDFPAPVNVYGASKLAGEFGVRAVSDNHILVRTCGLYGVAGASGKGGNFVQLMLRLAGEGKEIKVVDDQVCTPTYTRDLADAIVALIERGERGLFHVTGQGECSWYRFAEEIFRLAGVQPSLTPTTTEAFGARATRPPYSVLDNAHLRAVGLEDLRPWQEALEAYLVEKGVTTAR
jgi:dTDP-4-dehydrorhamnose reductase